MMGKSAKSSLKHVFLTVTGLLVAGTLLHLGSIYNVPGVERVRNGLGAIGFF